MSATQWNAIKAAFAEALELDASERSAALEVLSPEVRERVERLIAAHDEANDFIEKPILVEREQIDGSGTSNIPEQIDEYRIIEQIGVGGMGTVHLAEHSGEGFSHRVALKLIKRGMDTESVLKRFLMERQILSNLEHPNIARMIDGGSTPDGVPYFVMEFVDGEEIRRYCDAKHLGLNARLDLFQKVCSAVASAHQKLIVHRDLKPTNILVTKDGEPKLLDFGIAKLLSPDFGGEEATVTQFRVMTPEYASPEQIAGEPTSTSADIYSLGVVLYELLTGQRPRLTKGGSPQQILDKAFTEEPPKPSTVAYERRTFIQDDRTGDSLIADTERVISGDTKGIAVEPALLRGDLDNIILKALRRDPERRYQSVQEFAEDIQRFRDGLPVRAVADSVTYRLGKFVKRHRAGVVASATVGLLLIATSGIAAWQAVKANEERTIAESRFNDVRTLANSLIFDLHDSIRDLPGSTPARKALVGRSIEYLDKLAKESSKDMSLRSELASAYERVGDIQGGPLGQNLGDIDGAIESYNKALALRESLFEQGGGDEKYAGAMLHSRLFRVNQVQGDLKGAETHLRSAISLLDGVSSSDSLQTVTAARFSMELGDLLLSKPDGETEAALESYRKSIALAHSVTPGDGDQINAADGLTMNERVLSVTQLSYRRLGQYFESHERYAEAKEAFSNALAESEKLLAASDKAKPIAEVVRGLSMGNFGRIEAITGNVESGLNLAEQSRDICRQTLERDPKNYLAKSELGLAYGNIGIILRIKGDNAGSLSNFTRSIEIQKEIAIASPQDTYNMSNLASSYSSIGSVLEKTDRGQAKKYYQLSYDIWSSMRDKNTLPGYFSGKPEEMLAKIQKN